MKVAPKKHRGQHNGKVTAGSGSLYCLSETSCGSMLSSLFTLQSLLCHRRMKPTRHEDGAGRRRLRSFKLAVEDEEESWKARIHAAPSVCRGLVVTVHPLTVN